MIALWIAALLGAGWLASWGAGQVAGPLRTVRKRWNLSAAAGGTLVGIASAGPETQVNIAAATRGVVDIGLGAMLGSNILAMPLTLTAAYLATRKPPVGAPQSAQAPPWRLPVTRTAATVQAIPYLGILALVAVLTLPAAWRGLQPIDGWILAAAYLAYFAQALLRDRHPAVTVPWNRRELALGVAGLLALAAGGYTAVVATEPLAEEFGLSPIVAGLFLTGAAASLPEVFAAWRVSRAGQVTSAVTTVIGDNAMTTSLAMLPIALVTVDVGDLRLYCVNLAYVAVHPALYAGFILTNGKDPGFRRWQVAAFDVVLLSYFGVMFLWVLRGA